MDRHTREATYLQTGKRNTQKYQIIKTKKTKMLDEGYLYVKMSHLLRKSGAAAQNRYLDVKAVRVSEEAC